MAKRSITILIPIYNESGNIAVLVREIDRVVATLPAYDFRLLFVDDGSQDDSVAQLEALAAADPRIGVIELSRNFGKELALTAGIHSLDCDAAIIMDADLQHPPSYIPTLVRKWEEGYEIVATKRTKSERQPLVRRLGSHLFYWLLNSISEFKMEPGTTDFRLLDRIVVDALKQFTENNRMVRGLIDWMGYKKTFVEFEAPERHSGKPGYSYSRLLQLALNSFMAFSLVPLKLAGYLGVFVITAFGLLLAFMLCDRFWLGGRFGFTPIAFVIVTNVIMNGVVLACIGLVAIYIGHIHTEVIDRPLYLVRKTVGMKGEESRR
jgi:glycosyltransferase involved in cell wall biosynthesis